MNSEQSELEYEAFLDRPGEEKVVKAIFLPLGKGIFTTVDSDCSIEVLTQKWSANSKSRGRVYAFRSERGTGGRKHIALHRQIAGPDSQEEVDHKDGDTLNNLRGNLRVCSHAQNSRNLKKSKSGSSRYKGVSERGGRWRASITLNRKQRHLGTFDSEIEAALAYDTKARELFGEFASPNFA